MSFTSGSQNGQYEIALAIKHMPVHSHTMKIYNSGSEAKGYGLSQVAGFMNRPIVEVSDNNQWSTGSTGSGANFGIMQPYLAVYFWKRTA